jgi:hypothetical protein
LLFANLGTDDVSISAKFGVAGNPGTLITTMADNGDVQVAPSTGNSAFNVKLALVPLAVEKKDGVTYKKGDNSVNSALFKATTTAFTDASKKVSGIAFDNTNSAVSFSLAHPSWNIKSKGNEQYELEMDETTNDKAVAFQIGGYCNSKADWSDFTKDSNPRTISLTATFTIDKAASDFAPTAEFNLADKTVAAKNSGKLIEVPTLAAAEEDDGSVLVSNGTVDMIIVDSTIKATDTVTFTPVETTGTDKNAFSKAISGSNGMLSVADGKLTISKSYITALKNAASRGTGKFKVTTTSTSKGRQR